MTETATTRRMKSRKLADWLTPRLRRVAIPSWLLSLMIHGGLIALLIWYANTHPRRGDFAGEDGEGFRTVGLELREPRGGGERPASAGPAQAAPAEDAPAPQWNPTDESPPPPDDATAPPVPLQLPSDPAVAVVGAGLPTASPAVPTPPGSGLVRPASRGAAGGPASQGVGAGVGVDSGPGVGGDRDGSTSLFGVRDAGQSFVYVIDRSTSMDEDGLFRAAKAELCASIEKLNETQNFQVIFYNQRPLLLTTRDQKFPMFRGNDTERLRVLEQFEQIQPDGGTRHVPALIEALKLNPDVIFFLTDGAEPPLTKQEHQELLRRNRAGSHIHCIEFGRGPPLTAIDGSQPGNFLVLLAKEHQGRYIYRDVSQFTR